MRSRAAVWRHMVRAERVGIFMTNIRTEFHMPSLNIPLVIAFKSPTKGMLAQLRCRYVTFCKHITSISAARVALTKHKLALRRGCQS
jgi:hypothetical protein